MIKTTLGKLAESYHGLRGVLALPLPAKTSFHAAKLARLISDDVQSFNHERDGLVRKHGTKNPDVEGQDESYTVPVANLAALNAELKELSETSATVDYAPLTLDMLDGHDIKGEYLLSLGPLLAENAQ